MIVRLVWANRAVNQILDTTAVAVKPDSLYLDDSLEGKKKYWDEVENVTRQYQARFFPFGWVERDSVVCDHPNFRAFPDFNSDRSIASKIIGLLFTAFMVSLGADFWFKVLAKYIKVQV